MLRSPVFWLTSQLHQRAEAWFLADKTVYFTPKPFKFLHSIPLLQKHFFRVVYCVAPTGAKQITGLFTDQVAGPMGLKRKVWLPTCILNQGVILDQLQ